MMKSTLIVSCLVAFGMPFAAMTANADTVTMGFTGPQGDNSGGVYTYPYNFTINGSGNYTLICTTSPTKSVWAKVGPPLRLP